MKFFQYFLIAIFALALWAIMFGLIYFGNNLAAGSTVVYNCSIAEISPDFSLKMREECRKLLSKPQ